MDKLYFHPLHIIPKAMAAIAKNISRDSHLSRRSEHSNPAAGCGGAGGKVSRACDQFLCAAFVLQLSAAAPVQLRAGAGCCICFGIVIPQQAHTLSCAIQRNLDPHTARKIYPVEKLHQSTGLDIRKFDDALTFKIALMVVNYMAPPAAQR